MRKSVLILLCLFASFFSQSQGSNTDSLLTIVRNANTVRQRMEAARLYLRLYIFNIDSAGYSAQQLVKIGKETKYKDVQAFANCAMAWYLHQRGERFTALQKNVEALKQADEVGDSILLASVYLRFSNIYSDLRRLKEVQKKALDYLEGINSAAATNLKVTVFENMGVDYIAAMKYDSALLYLKKSEELRMQVKDSSNLSSLYNNFAAIYFKLNNPQMAVAYLNMAVHQADREGAFLSKANSFGQYASYYRSIGNNDSALVYLDRIFSKFDMKTLPPAWTWSSALLYYDLYKDKGDMSNALKYIEIYRTAKPKADSLQQAQQARDLEFEEQVRQLSIEEEKLLAVKERKQNLQYAAIAFVVITFLVLFLVFSHSTMANQRLIKFLGILSLLIVFEFINLFIHPYLDKWTDHSVPMMLGIMVCIAALLVPLHHKLEHWITHKLVEKNNKIRLAAAKKTIAKLEAKVSEAPVENSTNAQQGL